MKVTFKSLQTKCDECKQETEVVDICFRAILNVPISLCKECTEKLSIELERLKNEITKMDN